MDRSPRRTTTAVEVVAIAAAWALAAAAAESGAKMAAQPSRSSVQSSMAGGSNVDERPTAVVRVDNPAAVRADDLFFAKDRAAGVFGKIGARVIWIDEDTPLGPVSRRGLRSYWSKSRRTRAGLLLSSRTH
jgi:hypothetical protein